MLSVPVVLDQSQVFSLGFYIFERAMRFVFVRFFVTSFMILFGQEFGNGVARVFPQNRGEKRLCSRPEIAFAKWFFDF